MVTIESLVAGLLVRSNLLCTQLQRVVISEVLTYMMMQDFIRTYSRIMSLHFQIRTTYP